MRVLVVDDHRLFRDGMKSLLSQWRADIAIAEVGRIADAINVLASQGPFDLILLDLTLPDSLDPDKTIGSIIGLAAGAPIVAVSMVEQHPALARVIGAGVRGFIRKSDSAQVMLATLELVLAGGTSIPADLHNSGGGAASELATPLSERQIAVLRLIAKGLSNKEIARELEIAEATVKVHVHRILQIIGESTRAKAAAWAHGCGLIKDDSPI